jgi:hypothetical protein
MKQRAQGKPGADHTHGPRANKKHGGRTTGEPEQRRLSLRSGFTAYFALSQVTGLSCHLHLRKVSRKLERQHRGARTTRLRRPLSSGVRLSPSPASTASRRNVRDVRTSPLIGRDARIEITDLPDDGSEIFSRGGMDRFLVICPSGCFVAGVNANFASRRSAHPPRASRIAWATFVACDTRPIFAPAMIFRRRGLAFGTMPSSAVAPAGGWVMKFAARCRARALRAASTCAVLAARL